MKISVCNRRTDKKYKNQDMSWDYIINRNSNPIRTSETAEEYPKLPKGQRDNLKDNGGFVGGWLKGGIRKNGNVICRTIGTLDADYVPLDVDFLGRVKEVLPNTTYFIYSTHSHTPTNKRYRLVVMFSREVSEDEYPAIMRMVAKQINMDLFDDSTYQANRMMYWSSCPTNSEFVFYENKGVPLDADSYLAMYDDWTDLTQHPTSSRQSEVIKRETQKQQNPLEKDGIVGAFCRAYPDIEEVISTFLSDVYAPSATIGRYDYIPADSSAGVVIYDGIFSYSHHTSDPACGKLLNAFDLVRIHKFGEDKNSFNAMAQLALSDDRVKIQFAEDRKQSAKTDFADEDWRTKLTYQKNSGILENTLHNLELILEKDENLKAIVFNLLADGMEIKGIVPWKHPARFWRDADDAQLISYVDNNYGTFSVRNYKVAVTKVSDDRSYHPIREMFEALPVWDKVPRAETLLIDYLGADDNTYVRQVTRKILCAAYMRVYNPGIKFDNLIVLNGDQGIGKSTLIANLGMDWYSDSLALSDMNDKTAAEKLQGYWILEIGELAGMKKADIDKVKAFISRQDDKYRASFGRRVTPHPRQCVFFGTTNSENGYLRDITGNRRFWNVKVSGKGKYKPWDMSIETVKQIWAEIAEIAKQGEKLYLDADIEEYAKKEQRAAMEQDEREGIVREYLDMLLPNSWNTMDIYARREYFRDRSDPTRAKGTEERNLVSNIEIWCECFGKAREDLRPTDSYAISAIMTRIENWKKCTKAKRIPHYGLQRLYTRMW